MVAPFPTAIQEIQRRTIVNRILEDCWDKNEIVNNISSGYEIQAIDEWIVDNQRQNRKEQEIENDGEMEDELQALFQSQESSSMAENRHSSQDSITSSTPATKSADSLFSNYFLSLHLLFSLPSIGDQDDDDIVDSTPEDRYSSESKRNNLSPLTTMKPSTYGEITPLGVRQLFGVMGLLDRTDTANAADSSAAHFVDLGSGTGKLVGQAVLELSSTLGRATGVELSPSRHASAIRAKEALIEWLHREHPNDGDRSDSTPSTRSSTISSISVSPSEKAFDAGEILDKLELIEGDLFDVDLSTATHIYVASLCFPDNLMLRLEETLSQRIARQKQQQQQQQQDQVHNGNDNTTGRVANLQWVATLRKFPNDLGGIHPIIRFMEMSWTSPLGCAVYLYRCDTTT